MPFKRICVFRLSALGDVVMTVPMVRALQASFPMARLTWVIDRVAHRLLEGLSGVDFIVIDNYNIHLGESSPELASFPLQQPSDFLPHWIPLA